MATGIYTNFRNVLGGGGTGAIWKLVSDGQIIAVLVDSTFVFDDTHTDLSQIKGVIGNRANPTALTMKDGYVVAGNSGIVFSGVDSGKVVAGIVYYYAQGDSANHNILIGYDTSAAGLPYTSVGSDIHLNWPDNKILKI